MSPRGVRAAASLALGLALACDTATGPAGTGRPPRTGDGWETASLDRVGMTPEPLAELLELISTTENHLIHSVLIARHGKLVFEAYWPGIDLEPGTLNPIGRDFDRETLHYVASVSKSLTSALVGIAIDQGLIHGVGDSVFSFFPEYGHLETQDNRQIVLEHLLAFSSGYDWNEFVYGFDDPRDSHYQLFNTADPIGYLLGRPMTSVPGTTFHYNSGDTNILGEIVRRSSGWATLIEFADQVLFRPLQIEDYDWVRLPLALEITFASGGASLRPRDMAKLGALYLNGGVWNGRRVISTEWVDASTMLTTPLAGSYRTLYGYGYNWWLGRSPYAGGTVEYFRAAGWGGQDVYVFPALDLVVVFTAGGYYDTRPLEVNDLLEQYIFRAIVE